MQEAERQGAHLVGSAGVFGGKRAKPARQQAKRSAAQTGTTVQDQDWPLVARLDRLAERMYKLGIETRCFSAILVHLFEQIQRIADECTKLASVASPRSSATPTTSPSHAAARSSTACHRRNLPHFAGGHLATRLSQHLTSPQYWDSGSDWHA